MLQLLLPLALAAPVVLPPAPGPLDSPYKGFAAYADAAPQYSCPVSMAYEYAGWKTLEPKEDEFDFANWEGRTWNKPLALGKPVIIRVYLDYPAEPSAIPEWILAKGVKTKPYTEFGGGISPDYENPVLVSALCRLIAALGSRYDKNPRVAFVQLGILGHWGEWHTYPRDELFASPRVQTQIVEAFRAAFPHKQLLARKPAYVSCQVPWLGFHDDMIPDDTLGPENWQFVTSMNSGHVADNWKRAPTGGEMVPFAAHRYLGKDWDLLERAVKAAHFTWIGPYCPALETLSPEESKRVDELIRMMGYEYRLTTVSATAGRLKIDGNNLGVAPFYYPWPVRLAAFDETGRLVRSWTAPVDLRTWLPGPFSLETAPPSAIPSGNYRVGMSISDPGSVARPIKFANDLPQIQGFTIIGKVGVSQAGLHLFSG